MQVIFIRWCLKAKDCTPVSINPKRVDSTEHFIDAFINSTGESFPAATKIVMQGKQEYTVQGHLDDVVDKLNQAEDE